MGISGLRGRALPGATCTTFGKWSSVYRQVSALDAVRSVELLLCANDSGGGNPSS
jgi:hypothetical protein